VGCDQVKAFVRGLITIDDRMVSEIAVERLLPEIESLAA
jgi:purine-binding chemotaxis protein CheW